MKTIYKKGKNGGKKIDHYEWTPAEEAFLREAWASSDWNTVMIAEHFNVSRTVITYKAIELHLGRKQRCKHKLLFEHPEWEEVVRNQYPTHSDLKQLATDLGVDFKTLKAIAVSIGVKRDETVKREEINRQYYERQQQLIADAQAMLDSLGIHVEAEQLMGNNWPLPSGFSRNEVRKYAEKRIEIKLKEMNKAGNYKPENAQVDAEALVSHDLYEIRSMDDEFIAFIKVPERNRRIKVRNDEKRRYEWVEVWTEALEAEYQRIVETRALSMVVELPFKPYQIVDFHDRTILFTRTPADYFSDERSRLQHLALISVWRTSNYDTAKKGWNVLNSIAPRLRKLNGKRQHYLAEGDQRAKEIAAMHEQQQAEQYGEG